MKINDRIKDKLEEIRRQLDINVQSAKQNNPEGSIKGMLHSQEMLTSHVYDRLKELESLILEKEVQKEAMKSAFDSWYNHASTDKRKTPYQLALAAWVACRMHNEKEIHTKYTEKNDEFLRVVLEWQNTFDKMRDFIVSFDGSNFEEFTTKLEQYVASEESFDVRVETREYQPTHLRNWLQQGWFHCQHGSQEWAEQYLKGAAQYIESLEMALVRRNFETPVDQDPLGTFMKWNTKEGRDVIVICSGYVQENGVIPANGLIPFAFSLNMLKAALGGHYYHPRIIEFKDAGVSELIVKDTAVVYGEDVMVQVVRDMTTMEIVGFKWPSDAIEDKVVTDENGCITTPDGRCVSPKQCMHSVTVNTLTLEVNDPSDGGFVEPNDPDGRFGLGTD